MLACVADCSILWQQDTEQDRILFAESCSWPQSIGALSFFGLELFFAGKWFP